MPHDPFGFVGALVDTQIQVAEAIGEGGFSVVYRAHHKGLDEPIALKCLKLPPGLAPKMTEDIVERFRVESRISYRLSQGNLDIVRSISSGEARAPLTGTTVPYIALEWLEGPSLAQDLKSRRAAGIGGRPLAEVIDRLDPAAVALDYAHKQGVVHRDVKPGNFVLARTRDGGTRIKVLDFGLAKVIDPEGIGLGATSQTVSSIILCSPAYGAPEQFNVACGPIGSHTDVYSFAMIVLEMISGDKIRSSTSIAVAAREAMSPTPVSPLALGYAVSPEMDALFQRTLQLDGSRRPRDLGEFWSELRRLAAPRPSARPAAPAQPLYALPPQSVTRPIQIGLAAQAILLSRAAAASAPAAPPSLGGTLAMPERPMTPKAPEPDEPGPSGTHPMPERPRTPFPQAMVVGAFSSPVDVSRAPESLPPASLANTVIGEPVRMPSNAPPPVRVPPMAMWTGSAAPSPAAPLAPPAAPPAATAGPPRTSPALIVLSLLVFGLLVATAGYLVHRWYDARHAGDAVGYARPVDTDARAT